MIWEKMPNDEVENNLSSGHLLDGVPFLIAAQMIAEMHKNSLVVLSHKVREEIVNHLKTSKLELGGLLIGELYYKREMSQYPLIKVTRSIASAETVSTPTFLRMNREIWSDSTLELKANEKIVGWYHSHPNLGAFFSSTDRRTQRALFNHEYSLGLVIDWVRNDEMWFISKEAISMKSEQILYIDI